MAGWQRARPVGSDDAPAPGSTMDVGRVRAVLVMGGVPWDQLDDGVQQVRLKMLEQRAGPDRPEIRDEAAWCAVVASRVAADWHRSRSRDTRLRERLTTRWTQRPPTDHPQAHRTLALAVSDGLDGLPPAQRQILVLRYYADLSVRDIAEQLDIPEGTVKSRLHTAVSAIRARLRDTEVI